MLPGRAARSDRRGSRAGALYRAGTVGMIMRMRKLSDGGLKMLVQGLCRARIQRFVAEQPCYRVRLERIDDAPPARSVEVEALMRSVRQNVDKLPRLGKTLQPELAMVVQSVDDPGRMADLVASNLTLKVPEAQALLGDRRAGRAPDPGQPGAGERDRDPRGAGAIQARRQGGDVEDAARLLPARAAAADPERAGRRRRPRRGDRGAARQGATGGPARRGARPRPTSSCAASSRCTPRAPRRA